MPVLTGLGPGPRSQRIEEVLGKHPVRAGCHPCISVVQPVADVSSVATLPFSPVPHTAAIVPVLLRPADGSRFVRRPDPGSK